MALVPSLPRMTTGSGSSASSSSSTFLLHKTDITISDSQFIDILLDDTNHEHKIQAVNRWCKNARRNRLSTILDATQRHNILSSLINTLQQTSSAEYLYNCLTLILEIQANIYHYDQRTFLPGLFPLHFTSWIDLFSCSYYSMFCFDIKRRSIYNRANPNQTDSFNSRRSDFPIYLSPRWFKIFQHSSTRPIYSIVNRCIKYDSSV